MHCVLCIVLYVLYSIHCMQFYAMYYMHFNICIEFCTLFSLYPMHCIICIVLYAYYSLHHTLYILFKAFYYALYLTKRKTNDSNSLQTFDKKEYDIFDTHCRHLTETNTNDLNLLQTFEEKKEHNRFETCCREYKQFKRMQTIGKRNMTNLKLNADI